MDDKPDPLAPRPGSLLAGFREHRVYGAAVGYFVAAWIILQVAAIVLPGFGAPAWVLRALMIVLALGLGVTLLAVWGRDRRVRGRPLLPRAVGGRLAWALTALLPAAMVAGFFGMHPLGSPAPVPLVDAAEPVDKSVAVLPFDNFSEDKDSAVFADGVQDEVLTDLAKVADLKVISRSSVLQYKKTDARNLREIGKALGVAHLVEGSVQRAGNRIKVTAQLIDARTDAHQWADQYVRELSDIFGIQNEIAQAIAGRLQAVISPQEHVAMSEVPTRDLKAYELYLRAVEVWNSFDQADRDVEMRAVGLLGQATTLDPGFARAFALLTEVQSEFYHDFESTPAQEAVARELAENVARLRPGAGEARRARGVYEYWVRRDFVRAKEELTEAARLSPNDDTVFYYLALTDRRQGRWEDALSHIRRAVELGPENGTNVSILREILVEMRRAPEALAALDRWIAAHPQGFWAYLDKARLLLEEDGLTDDARAVLARLPAGYDPSGATTALQVECDCAARDFDAAGRDLAACKLADLAVNDVCAVPRAFLAGCLARYRGDKDAAASAFTEARAALADRVNARPDDAWLLVYLAATHAALGQSEMAIEEARRAVAMHPPERDATDGPMLALRMACVQVWTGERDEAIRTLQALAAKQNGPGYGVLRLHPDWDGLRGDVPFDALVASLAPKP